jgi:hypothetical protein
MLILAATLAFVPRVLAQEDNALKVSAEFDTELEVITPCISCLLLSI